MNLLSVRAEGRHGLRCIGAHGPHLDLGTRRGRQHHQAHDGTAGDFDTKASDENFCLKAFRAIDEFGCGTGMQAAPVNDRKG